MVRNENEYGSIGRDRIAAKVATLVGSLSSEQLERLTIDAIRRHRDTLGRAEHAYQVWKTEAADRDAAAASAAYEEYVGLTLAHESQQVIVAILIEHLGRIPKVPNE